MNNKNLYIISGRIIDHKGSVLKIEELPLEEKQEEEEEREEKEEEKTDNKIKNSKQKQQHQVITLLDIENVIPIKSYFIVYSMIVERQEIYNKITNQTVNNKERLSIIKCFISWKYSSEIKTIFQSKEHHKQNKINTVQSDQFKNSTFKTSNLFYYDTSFFDTVNNDINQIKQSELFNSMTPKISKEILIRSFIKKQKLMETQMNFKKNHPPQDNNNNNNNSNNKKKGTSSQKQLLEIALSKCKDAIYSINDIKNSIHFKFETFLPRLDELCGGNLFFNTHPIQIELCKIFSNNIPLYFDSVLSVQLYQTYISSTENISSLYNLHNTPQFRYNNNICLPIKLNPYGTLSHYALLSQFDQKKNLSSTPPNKKQKKINTKNLTLNKLWFAQQSNFFSISHNIIKTIIESNNKLPIHFSENNQIFIMCNSINWLNQQLKNYKKEIFWHSNTTQLNIIQSNRVQSNITYINYLIEKKVLLPFPFESKPSIENEQVVVNQWTAYLFSQHIELYKSFSSIFSKQEESYLLLHDTLFHTQLHMNYPFFYEKEISTNFMSQPISLIPTSSLSNNDVINHICNSHLQTSIIVSPDQITKQIYKTLYNIPSITCSKFISSFRNKFYTGNNQQKQNPNIITSSRLLNRLDNKNIDILKDSIYDINNNNSNNIDNNNKECINQFKIIYEPRLDKYKNICVNCLLCWKSGYSTNCCTCNSNQVKGIFNPSFFENLTLSNLFNSPYNNTLLYYDTVLYPNIIHEHLYHDNTTVSFKNPKNELKYNKLYQINTDSFNHLIFIGSDQFDIQHMKTCIEISKSIICVPKKNTFFHFPFTVENRKETPLKPFIFGAQKVTLIGNGDSIGIPSSIGYGSNFFHHLVQSRTLSIVTPQSISLGYLNLGMNLSESQINQYKCTTTNPTQILSPRELRIFISSYLETFDNKVNSHDTEPYTFKENNKEELESNKVGKPTYMNSNKSNVIVPHFLLHDIRSSLYDHIEFELFDFSILSPSLLNLLLSPSIFNISQSKPSFDISCLDGFPIHKILYYSQFKNNKEGLLFNKEHPFNPSISFSISHINSLQSPINYSLIIHQSVVSFDCDSVQSNQFEFSQYITPLIHRLVSKQKNYNNKQGVLLIDEIRKQQSWIKFFFSSPSFKSSSSSSHSIINDNNNDDNNNNVFNNEGPQKNFNSFVEQLNKTCINIKTNLESLYNANNIVNHLSAQHMEFVTDIQTDGYSKYFSKYESKSIHHSTFFDHSQKPPSKDIDINKTDLICSLNLEIPTVLRNQYNSYNNNRIKNKYKTYSRFCLSKNSGISNNVTKTFNNPSHFEQHYKNKFILNNSTDCRIEPCTVSVFFVFPWTHWNEFISIFNQTHTHFIVIKINPPSQDPSFHSYPPSLSHMHNPRLIYHSKDLIYKNKSLKLFYHNKSDSSLIIPQMLKQSFNAK